MKRFVPILLLLVLLTTSVVYGESKPRPEINFIGGYIIVEGTGVVPQNISNQAQARALGRLAAKVDAQRNMLEIISGLQLNSETSMVNLMANDVVKTRVEGILHGAQIIPGSEYILDGLYHLEMRVDIKDFTPLIYPAPSTNRGLADQENYTGLIIDAEGLEISASNVSEIRDLKGNLIYSVNRAFYRPQESIFKLSRSEALSDPRAGDNPLIIRAVRTGSADGSILLVTEGDGRWILTALERTDVFLLSKILIISGGSTDDSEK